MAKLPPKLTAKLTANQNKKTFFLGLGHQKCGTSWLFEYLNSHDEFDGGVTKEYHIWDALDHPLFKHYNIKASDDFRNQIKNSMQNDEDFYFAFFDEICAGNVTMSGDITPSYSALGTDRLKFIRDGFKKRNIDCKAIILLRDPLTRIKSAVISNLGKNHFGEGMKEASLDPLDALDHYYRSEHCSIRTRYDKTIENACSVFGKQDVYVGIYENMFEASEIARLSNFCGITANPDFHSIVVNPTTSKLVLTHDLDEKIKAEYQQVYDYCLEKFPITKSLWKS